MRRNIGYIRLSRDDKASHSIDNQRKDLLNYDPSMTLYVDAGVSGENNLTSLKAQWHQLWLDFTANPQDTTIVVVTFDRLGRKKGKVLSVVEDIIDSGGELFCLRDNKRYNDLNDLTQDLELYFSSFSNEQYRKDVQRKTRRALDELQAAGIKLGRRPALTERNICEIKELHARGLGFTSIGKVVRTQRQPKPGQREGAWTNTSPRTIKQVLQGTYVSREQWERTNTIKRLQLQDSLGDLSDDTSS